MTHHTYILYHIELPYERSRYRKNNQTTKTKHTRPLNKRNNKKNTIQPKNNRKIPTNTRSPKQNKANKTSRQQQILHQQKMIRFLCLTIILLGYNYLLETFTQALILYFVTITILILNSEIN